MTAPSRGYRLSVPNSRPQPHTPIPRNANEGLPITAALPGQAKPVRPKETPGMDVPSFMFVTRANRPFPTTGDLTERLQWCRQHPQFPLVWTDVVKTLALADRNSTIPGFFRRLIIMVKPNNHRVVFAGQLAKALENVAYLKPVPGLLAYSGGKLWSGKIWVFPSRLERQHMGAATQERAR